MKIFLFEFLPFCVQFLHLLKSCKYLTLSAIFLTIFSLCTTRTPIFFALPHVNRVETNFLPRCQIYHRSRRNKVEIPQVCDNCSKLLKALTELFKESRVLFDTDEVFTACYKEQGSQTRSRCDYSFSRWSILQAAQDDDVSESVEQPAINYNGVLGRRGAGSLANTEYCIHKCMSALLGDNTPGLASYYARSCFIDHGEWSNFGNFDINL